MSTTRRSLLLLAVLAVLTAGCGTAGGPKASGASTSTSDPAKKAPSPEMALKTAVRTAIRANVQLSTYVLWNNRIPVWATRSTRGPALTALRSAAATRHRQGIQIKNLSGTYTVISIALAPSYATATVVVRTQQRVAPYESGHRLGKAISATDHVRIQLHRLGNTKQFVVWNATPIK
jgi:hypothetical protein